MLNFERKQIAFNRVVRNDKIRYIVIHDTQNTNKGADSDAHFNYFNGGNRNSSADFFVDSEKILQVNDYTKYYTWHVGDGKGKNGITNQNSVGVEICINEDGNYKKAVEKAKELTKYLMKELAIPEENVIRHFDASGKLCPASMSENNWAKWNEFKSGLKSTDKFTDIKGNFAEKDIKELFDMGIINGVTDTEFKPDDTPTRAQLARISRNIIRYITGE